jgi:GNAT superfamily N-acetyltransferase
VLQRAAEVEAKVTAAVSRSLGDRVGRMLYIDTLATEPASQGWGYAGALLDSVGALVCPPSHLSKTCSQLHCTASRIYDVGLKQGDITDQAIWLKSTNEKNTGFYMSHGYTVVAEAVVGDDNPDWHGEPVVIKIVSKSYLLNVIELTSTQMVREPRQRHSTQAMAMA